MTTPNRPKIIVGTCEKCGRLWLANSTDPAKCAKCGGELVFSQAPEPPAVKVAKKEPPARKPEPKPEPKPARKGKKKVVVMPRRDPKTVGLPTYIEPLPLTDYEILVLGAECGAHVLTGEPPREAFIPGQLVTLINRFWGMALWVEYGQTGGER